MRLIRIGVTRAFDLKDQSILDLVQADGLKFITGEEMLLEIEETGSTGYIWIENTDCGDKLSIRSDTYADPKYFYTMDDGSEITLPGAPGTRRFVLSAGGDSTVSGTCTFEAALARPWMFKWEDASTHNQAYKTFKIPLTIN